MIRTRSHARLCSPKPTRPNFRHLFRSCNANTDEVAKALHISDRELQNVMENSVPAIERWFPVFAKCALLTRRGLFELLSCKSSESTSDSDSIGLTIRSFLEQRNRLQEAKEAILSESRLRRPEFHVTDKMLEDFFGGMSEEAEDVAKFALYLALATDPTNIFSLFI
eukprot:m.230072 g.230072  ORF g.230072 m.230072 type:complete len:167 (-) comp12004_c0_seq1:176-676(-)